MQCKTENELRVEQITVLHINLEIAPKLAKFLAYR